MTAPKYQPTQRQRWADAIDDDDSLDPFEYTIARLFARFGGNGVDRVWVAGSQLEKRMGRTKSRQCVRSLVDKGWLFQTRGPRQHLSPEYRLTIPPSSMSRDDTLGADDGTSTSVSVSPRDTLEDARVSRDNARVSRGELQSVGTRTPISDGTSNGTHSVARDQLTMLLAEDGVGEDDVDHIIAIAKADPTTTSNPIGRLLKVTSYRAECIRNHKAEVARDDAHRDEQLPKCPDCRKSLARCEASNLKVAPEERCRRFDELEEAS